MACRRETTLRSRPTTRSTSRSGRRATRATWRASNGRSTSAWPPSSPRGAHRVRGDRAPAGKPCRRSLARGGPGDRLHPHDRGRARRAGEPRARAAGRRRPGPRAVRRGVGRAARRRRVWRLHQRARPSRSSGARRGSSPIPRRRLEAHLRRRQLAAEQGSCASSSFAASSSCRRTPAASAPTLPTPSGWKTASSRRGRGATDTRGRDLEFVLLPARRHVGVAARGARGHCKADRRRSFARANYADARRCFAERGDLAAVSRSARAQRALRDSEGAAALAGGWLASRSGRSSRCCSLVTAHSRQTTQALRRTRLARGGWRVLRSAKRAFAAAAHGRTRTAGR
jgi:hypothetical protein